MRMAVAIVVLDVVAILAFKLGGVEQRSLRIRYGFVGAWTVASALVVAFGMRAVRRARAAAQRS